MRACGPAAACALAAAGAAGAGPMAGPRVADDEPIAARGGVLMVPMIAERPGDRWPESLELELADGRRVEGLVAWVHPLPPPAQRPWTHDPRGLGVRAIRPEDDSSASGGGAVYLLARLPAGAGGALRFGDQELAPRWIDPPPRFDGADRERLRRRAAADRPDPDSPLAYWRWVLLAEQLDAAPPPLAPYGPVGALVAEHYAGLWRFGLDRIAPTAAADRVRRALTVICDDGPRSFAAWVAAPAALSRLLELLLDQRQSPEEVAADAERWAAVHEVLAMRLASRTPGLATIGAVNTTRKPVIAGFRWLGADEVAAVVALSPGALERIEIEHDAGAEDAPPLGPGGPAGTLRILLMETAGRQRQLAVPVDALAARPPGVRLSPLRPTLTLAGTQGGWQRAVRDDRATVVELRKLGGRWEIFAECLRPEPQPGPADLSELPGPTAARGIEAVTVYLGARPGDVVMTVPERGWYRLFRGAPDEALEVHRRSYPDRWYCRIVLPEAWVGGAWRGGGPLLAGFVRTHGDGDAVETGPFASLPWSIAPGRAVIDLTTWDGVAR